MSLLPSIIFIASVILGTIYLIKFILSSKVSEQTTIFSLIGLIILFNMICFFYYLLAYPTNTGGNIKPTYILYVLPFMAVLTAELLYLVQKRKRTLFLVISFLLIAVLIHNIPTFFTRYILL